MIRRISVRGIVLHQSKLLCVRLKPYKDHLRSDNNYWCLPGGGLEDGEPLLQGIEREMIEETGIKPMVGSILYVQQFALGEKDYLEFFFHITNSDDYLTIDLTKTSHGMEEIEEIGFIDPTSARIMPEFLATDPLEEYVRNNGPAKVISRF